MSCFSCVTVVDTDVDPSKTDALTNQGTKKVVISAQGIATTEEEVQESMHEGCLKLKKGSVAYSWKTVKVVVEKRNILLYEKRDSVPTNILPLHVCSVRPISNKRFRVCCAPNIVRELRAVSNKLMREWVTVIQTGIARQLSSQTECKTHCGLEVLAALQRANEANKFCADCHAPNPKWVSISIGCIVCIECSGVHRHLGTTISKVKSFELDMWDERNEVIEKIGNADVNSAYEMNIFLNEKPSVTSGREVREKYIYNKYVRKLYARKSHTTNPINTQTKKKTSNVQISPANGKHPAHKRTKSQKPAIHIGSDVVALPSAKFNPVRRGSFAYDLIYRRGSLATPSPSAKNYINQRRHSLAPAKTISSEVNVNR